MAKFKDILYYLPLLVYFGTINAQRCIPGIVENVIVTSDNALQWSEALNPNDCTISEYVINIFDFDDGSQLQFQTGYNVLYYSLSELNMCTNYSFEVHALTDQNVLGPAEAVNGTTPSPQSLDLGLEINNATLQDGHITLTWDPNLGVDRCISYYRVVYWDEDNDPTDVYVTSPSFVLTDDPIPCMEYKFQVTAIIVNPDIEGPMAEIGYAGYATVPSPPKLLNIVTSNTTVNMTWSVPAYSENRCELTGIVVNTLGLLPGTSLVPIEDSPLRPDVVVFLQELDPDTAYTSLVSLENSVGDSKNVTVVFQTSDTFVFSYETDLYY